MESANTIKSEEKQNANVPVPAKKGLLKQPKAKSGKGRTVARGKAAPQYISIDVGSKAVKVVEGRYKGNKIQIKRLSMGSLSEKASFDGKILRKADVQGCIQNAIREQKMTSKEAVCTVDSTEVIQRELVIPKVNETEILGLVSYEISQYLPIDTSSYALQYKNLGDVFNEQGQQMKIMMCGIPKNIPSDYMDIVMNLNMKPAAMDVNTNVLEKLLELETLNNPKYAGKNIAFIDMGHSMLNIMFFHSGVYTFNRLIEVGGGIIDEAISKILSISGVEAERIKLHNLSKISALDLYKIYMNSAAENVNAGNNEELILRQTVGILENWAAEIEGAIKYYTSRNETNTIDEILIYGGSSAIKDMDRFLENKLRIQTRRLELLNCIEADPGVNLQEIPRYLNAIGALIRV